MKTKYKKLIEIAEIIGYEKNFRIGELKYKGEKYSDIYKSIQDEREVIFTPSFSDKFINYGLEHSEYDGYETMKDIYQYLEDPIEYLYCLFDNIGIDINN